MNSSFPVEYWAGYNTALFDAGVVLERAWREIIRLSNKQPEQGGSMPKKTAKKTAIKPATKLTKRGNRARIAAGKKKK